jgi:LPXTG-motif cell wall-anchored protein
MSQVSPSDPPALQHEIEQTRADLGETVEALAAKVDVKARTKSVLDQATSQATTAINDASNHATNHARTGFDQAKRATTELGHRAKTQSLVVRRSLRDSNLPTTLDRTTAWAAIAAVATLIAAAAWLFRRRRS